MKTRTYKIFLTSISILMLICLVLWATPTVNAQLVATNVVYSWDYGTQNPGYQNSNVTIYSDGGWQSFLHQIIGPGNNGNEFDATRFFSDSLQTLSGTLYVSSTFAGTLDYAVNMTDTDGIGQGFRTTRNWSLVFCDRIQDSTKDNPPPYGNFVKGDLEKLPPNEYLNTTPFSPTNRAPFIEFLPVIFMNEIQACTNGTCTYALVTRLVVNLDKINNTTQAPVPDGLVDPQYLIPAGYTNAGQPAPICFYAEAKRPMVSNWGGNLQARISAGGGDKTVNFKTLPAPTAVKLSSFGAHASGDDLSATSLFIMSFLLGAVSLTTAGILKFIKR